MERKRMMGLQQIVYKDQYVLSYAEYGDSEGFPILTQHGLIASIKDHALFNRLYQLGARVISIARPGYGLSSPYAIKNIGEWGDIAAYLVNELKLPRFDVLGMSSGAPYSYSIGHAFPEKVRNIYIFSGIPALYDKEVLSYWPHPVTNDASIAEMEQLAYDLFFSDLTEEDLSQNDIKDSMMNNCFGIAQDLLIRSRDWGFELSEIKANVFMRHSKADHGVPFVTAERTASLLNHCILEARENDVHFSEETLNNFFENTIAKFFKY
jgi:pimeloyl-ACP methyl ester carboxylesterase